ncbi:MAG: DUF2252 domain-containing protein [Microthrixaceae bacterium]|nr:DUF2252 domain-containing protein [Microthrixaceae bacterium]
MNDPDLPTTPALGDSTAPRPDVEQLAEQGRAVRAVLPRSAQGEWTPGPSRRDPVTLLEEQNEQRLAWLVPVRHLRMRESPFTFFRGSARIMAADLASMPHTPIEVQLGGDAHLSNFGAHASPERQLVFDQNDFDETLPGPFEWDLKRLATSVMVAARHLGHSPTEARAATAASVRAYRQAMKRYSRIGHLDLWYQYVSTGDVQATNGIDAAELAERVQRFTRRATKRNSLQAVRKLTEGPGTYRIRSDPPVLFPLRELPDEYDPQVIESVAVAAFEAYKPTLDEARRRLIGRYTLMDIGVKVVGVGSVGTRAFVLLLRGRDDEDPLFLQAKEATASVFEEFLRPSDYPNHGQRVVEGQRLVQAQSDIFLGWTAASGTYKRDYYVRQLRDWKGSVETDNATPAQLAFYGGLCGLTLARGHARSGDPEVIHGYVGGGSRLDEAIAEFAHSYARQNDEDYERFQQAIRDGRLEVAQSG